MITESIVLTDTDLGDLADIIVPGAKARVAPDGYSADMLRGIIARHLEARNDALTVIRGLLPDECWITHSADVRCTSAIGGTFPNGTVFTEEMCCLPCRIRAVMGGRA